MKSKKTLPSKKKTSALRSTETDVIEPEPIKKAAARKTKSKPAPETEISTTTKPRKGISQKSPLEIPSIFLEEDAPAAVPPSGPGQRYALGLTPPPERLETEGELPDSYGTQRLLLTARDPHWLYAHWDLTREQLRKYNSLSTDKHLVLRIYADAIKGKPAAEIHVHPESKHWFAHVEKAGTEYVAQLGFYGKSRTWAVISTSDSTLTPPEAMSDETSAEFATIPSDLPFTKLLSLVKEAVRENAPLAKALQQFFSGGNFPKSFSPTEWTKAQERALEKWISIDNVRRVWMGSLEITELIRRQWSQGVSSLMNAEWNLPSSFSLSSVSSPFGGQERGKGFWFNVNAELIIYGATEPDASVTIGGRVIKLRPDGSFSYRFSLPDGQYELPIVAVSNDKTDARAAELKFSRDTEYRGDVGQHPQDASLKPPLAAENF